MKKNHFKGLAFRLAFCLVLICILFIIHSCRKESKFGAQPLTDSVNKAKTWYESSYPITSTSSNGNISTLSVTPTADNTPVNYSQYVKPDWEHGSSYQRLGKAVIETPIDSKSKFSAALINKNTGAASYTKENSKTSFVILNDGKNYQAFVMIILANTTYIGNDPTKLAKNTYRKRDANFSGLVLYYTPKGFFVSSYLYKNGMLVPPSATTTSTGTTKGTQSLVIADDCTATPTGVNGKAVNSTQKTLGTLCIDWYLTTYADDVPIWSDYLFTQCYCVADGGGGSGTTTTQCGISGGGDDGGGGAVPESVNSKLAVNDTDDGGMGDPSNDSCTCQADEDALSTAADGSIDSTIISETDADVASDSKTSEYNWSFYVSSSQPYSFVSDDKTYKRSDDGVNWYYTNIAHLGHWMSGTFLGGSMSLNVIYATPTFTSSQATMTIEFNAIVSTTVCGAPVTTNYPVKVASHTWH